MKKIKLILYIFSFTLIFINSLKAENSELVDKISKNLRCLICQGQSVYDSNSDFANSMKLLIKKKIKEGKTENEIYEFLKNRYGEWIVYDPEINKNTILLWSIPLILFVSGGLLIVRKVSIK
tara:strand:- start:339 stop:704 length:366 start_codon:yes stop_codon:yes gene_type:complete